MQPTNARNMVRMDAVSKRYAAAEDGPKAVSDLSLEIKEGTWLTLLGPSGCGKTTTLRMIAGLESVSTGEISIDGNVVASPSRQLFTSTEDRPIGMVFQSYALWPHMTAYENVAFPLQIAKPRIPKREVKNRVEEILSIVGMEGYESRPVPMMSGGQQQRVALARALVRKPKVLLLDEPLSNLDAALRHRMGALMRELQEELHITTVFVTHDQTEALAMSDHLILMRHGQAIQYGTPRSVYEYPNSEFSAEFFGAVNSLPIDGTVEELSPTEFILPVEGGRINLSQDPYRNCKKGNPSVVMFRQDALTFTHDLATKGERSQRPLRGTIRRISYRGRELHFRLLTPSDRELSILREVDSETLSYRVGEQVILETAKRGGVWVY